MEWNPQPMGKDNTIIVGAPLITITEPCDYNSNVAYYTRYPALMPHNSVGTHF